MTLIVIRHLQIGDRVFHHGDEVPPDLLSRETIDKMLDRKQLDDCTERRSVYRLLHRFSGCSEKERLGDEEIAACALS